MTAAVLLAVAATFSFGEVKVECEKPDGWTIALSREVASDGAEIARLTFDRAEAAPPPKTTLSFETPQIDAGYLWDVNTSACRLPPDWGAWKGSEIGGSIPLYVCFNDNDRSRLALAASECARHVNVCCGVREEGSVLVVKVAWFDIPEAPISHYETSVRIDTRDVAFADAVRASVAWLEQAGGYTPCRVPDAAFDPLYSTWYSFHQNVFAKDIEDELALAAKLGMKTVILDDGWQTDDTNRGYAFCGDWRVSPRRFPDMAAHVRRAHELGLKYMVWYSVPFIGRKSANYERFKGKYLREVDGLQTAVLDPRFPEVRRFLIDTYVRAMKEWDLDGFKLDFIDAFHLTGTDPAVKENFAGRDILTVPAAVNRLMTDVHDALAAIKPDVLIEFRQSYVGPAIRQFGNMLRVGDCPGDARRNRFAIANLRLASGSAAVHADMLEWNFAEPPATSARFIINAMFGVIQYSVMLRDAPEPHRAMIRKWMDFAAAHRDTLLHGKFTPHHPELMYPVIEAESEKEVIIGLYDDGRVVDVPSDKKTFVMNATGKDSFVIRRAGKLAEIACKTGDWIEL